MSVKEKLEKCIKEGRQGGERHKGLQRISISPERISNHIQKSKHNLQAMSDFRQTGYSDWSASAGFYALYHLLLAILAKEGYESRNQTCTFAFIEKMIEDGKLSITKEDLFEIFDKDVSADLEHSEKLLDLRERYQYSTSTIIEDQVFEKLKQRVKELYDKIRNEIEK